MGKHERKLEKISQLKEWLADGTNCELNDGWSCRTCSLAFFTDIGAYTPSYLWSEICEIIKFEKELKEQCQK